MVGVKYVVRDGIRPGTLEYREYQVRLAEIASSESTLIVISTGLGKTVIAALVAAKRLTEFPGSKVLFLAPSRPLVDQQARFLRRVLLLQPDHVSCMTGNDPPDTRPTIWAQSRVIVMTPQALQNDLVLGRYDLSDVSLVVYDEAHRGVGNYAYTFIAELYERQAEHPLSLGLTASPGHEAEQIRTVCENLRLSRVETRTEKSPDVRGYVVAVETIVRPLHLPPEVEALRDILFGLLDDYLKPLASYGYPKPNPRRVSRKEILALQKQIRAEIGSFTKVPRHLFLLVRNLTAALRLVHLLEFVGTQGLGPTLRYIQGMYEEIRNRKSSKGVRDLVSRSEFRQFEGLLQALLSKGFRHPKADLIVEVVSEQLSVDPDSRVLVFTRFRDTAAEIVELLSELDSVRVSRFVGQSSRAMDRGFSQKTQIAVLEGFRNNEFNVLVATQVGEEGLDIPECNLVVFYDCVPSIVPFIQRRGRTGRRTPGRVVLFVAKNTHDEFYYWSVVSKLKRMPSALRESEGPKEQTSLEEFAKGGVGPDEVVPATSTPSPTSQPTRQPAGQEQVSLIVDSRELPTSVARELARLGVALSGESLEVGDYVASDEVAVERKVTEDFLQSLVDGRLFSQLSALSSAYRRPVLIVEGGPLTGVRAINPASIYGALASIAVRFRVPIIWTRSAEETANVLYRIARMEQVASGRPLRIRPGDKRSHDAEVLEYILAGFPGVDSVISRSLLTHFGTLEKVFGASKEELQQVRGVGPKTAGTIRRLLKTQYPLHSDE